ncbi:MAG: metallophosphoesterase [Acetatifactor sp.]|nr:metallophosphoesterase [Acetatifactor sp.]
MISGNIKRYLPGMCAALLLFCGGCARLSPAQSQRTGLEPNQDHGQESDTEWEMHITEETLQLPGFQGEYDILFLTDTHVVIQDETDSPQEAAEGAARQAEFRNTEGVSAAEQFKDWIDYANEQGMDTVLLGGDIIDYPSAGNLDFLEEQLGRLDMPYLYTPGNHDWTYPWEYMTEFGKENYLPLLEPYMEENTDIHTWETEDLLIIAVDNSPGQVSHEAMERYEELLDTEKPVIVLVHVPFLTQSVLARAREEWDSGVVIGGGNYGGIYENDDSKRFVKLTTAEESPVELMLAGHVHFYDRDYIDGKKQILQVVGDAGYHGSAVRLHICGQ